MNLYQITEEMRLLDDLYLQSIDEETGEIADSDILEELDVRLKEMLINKSEGIIKYFRNEEASIKALKDEEVRLGTLRKRKEKKIEGFKRYIESNMMKIEAKNIETNLGKISLRKSVKTIVNEEFISKDERYWRAETVNKFDKATIKKLLVEGEVIEGASLEDSFSITIK
ncbi:MAG: siphovirus Gp157 family protein [Fusobacteriaceae bacterium]